MPLGWVAAVERQAQNELPSRRTGGQELFRVRPGGFERRVGSRMVIGHDLHPIHGVECPGRQPLPGGDGEGQLQGVGVEGLAQIRQQIGVSLLLGWIRRMLPIQVQAVQTPLPAERHGGPGEFLPQGLGTGYDRKMFRSTPAAHTKDETNTLTFLQVVQRGPGKPVEAGEIQLAGRGRLGRKQEEIGQSPSGPDVERGGAIVRQVTGDAERRRAHRRRCDKDGQQGSCEIRSMHLRQFLVSGAGATKGDPTAGRLQAVRAMGGPRECPGPVEA